MSESSQVARKGYDVFLSFHGGDTRYSFTGHLWSALNNKEIHTFMDDHEVLEKGEEIPQLLFKAVEDSRTAIVVLSENYGSSGWCLEELCYIVDCIKDKGRSIWPVFYGVDPSDVRHQTGPYGEAFVRHEEKYKMEKVIKWRNALSNVSCLPGWHFTLGKEYEHQLVDEIVEVVCKSFGRIIPLINTDYLVGIEAPLHEVLSYLELESKSDEVLMVGIYGAAGIGKTTLARETYNMIAKQFEASCIVPNVRENSRIHGLVHLQNMLLSQLIGVKDSNLTNVDEGAIMINNWLHLKKVLLVLDDVNTLEQLEALVGKPDWFGPGSRVIITTQDKHLLTFHRVIRTYEVQPLKDTDALELLSHQVFQQGNVGPSYTEMLNELVSYASGFPLVLKVIGSRLFGKSVEDWTNALHKYKRIPPNEIPETLNMENLRTLIMEKCDLAKASKYLPEGIRVRECSDAGRFNLNKLLRRRLPNIRHELAKLLETSQSSSQVLQTLQIVPLATQASQRVSLASQTSQRDYVALHISPRDLEDFLLITQMQSLPINYNKNRWRIVGLMSSVVGLFCFAFSPSFIRLIRGWNALKIILYVVFWWVIVFAFFSAEKPSRPVDHVWYKIKGFAILMFIAMYAFYYDKAVNGKPEILSLVSNAAFVLMSLSYSKLTKYAHEMGVFSFFLSCLAIQLWMVHWFLIFVAICFGFPLFYLHASSDPVKDKV